MYSAICAARWTRQELLQALRPDLLQSILSQIQYRSSTFITPADAFASAADFFEQARVRLFRDCGYEAKPSKNKSSKISVRCEEYAATGCPFRLCAFLEDHGRSRRWTLSPKNSVWDHAHKPKQPAASPVTPSSAHASTSGIPYRDGGESHYATPCPQFGGY